MTTRQDGEQFRAGLAILRAMAGGPSELAGRRPAELTLQEMEREALRLLRAADLEERRNAARAREVEALKAEVELLRLQQQTLARDLGAPAADLAALEKRVDALAEALERMRLGIEDGGQGALSSRIAAGNDE